MSSYKYAGVYAEILSDESLNETGIALHYEPDKGGGFMDLLSTSHDELELLKLFIPYYVSWDKKPRLLLDSRIEDIKIDEEMKPTARKLVEELRNRAQRAKLEGESSILIQLWLDLARDLENQSKHPPVDYEGEMARICEKWKHLNKNNDYEFSAKKMVSRRNINLDGGGREGYSEEGYSTKLKILKENGYIEITSDSEGKFKLTKEGRECCERSKIV